MLFSVVAVLAAVQLALAAPPAQATYCSEDNLLRAFQHTPTPASTYCATPTHYPTFLAVASYPPARLSSACSCFSRFATEPTPAPGCKADTLYSLKGNSVNLNYPLDILVTVDNNLPCAGGGHVITKVCGTAVGSAITYVPGATDFGADNCFPLDTFGIDITVNSQHIEYSFYSLNTGSTGAPYGVSDAALGYIDEYTAEFVPVSCGTPLGVCPTV